jgi:uncharacterized protein YcnI
VNLICRSLFAALIALGCVAPAAAHVTVTPASAAAGRIATLTFHCPSELPATTTTQLDVLPIAGWHSTITRRKLAQPLAGPHGAVTSAVDTIAWSGSIRAGAEENFTIRAGPLPRATGELAFKALQRYSNGTVVRWIELRNPGEAEPAYPAPVVRVR